MPNSSQIACNSFRAVSAGLSINATSTCSGTCSKKARLCLAEKGLPYVSHYVNLSQFENHTPEYHAINPNGVVPTLVHHDAPVETGPRIVSATTSAEARAMLRAVVTRGTASFGEVPGYQVAGKTGTADKPKPRGGYYEDKVIATFSSAF